MRLAILMFVCIGVWAQCSNTSYGNGFTCVKQAGTINAGSGSSATATFGSNTTATNQVLLIAFVCGNSGCSGDTSGITISFSNGASDSCTAMPGGATVFGDASSRWKGHACLFTSTSATTTYTVSTSGGTPYYLTAYASEWTGIASSSPWDVVAGTFQVGGSYSTATVTTASTTNATDLVVGFVTLNDANAITPGSGFTEIGEVSNGVEHEGKSVAATGAQSCTWSFSNTASWQGLCLTLKAGSGGGSPSPWRRRIIRQ